MHTPTRNNLTLTRRPLSLLAATFTLALAAGAAQTAIAAPAGTGPDGEGPRHHMMDDGPGHRGPMGMRGHPGGMDGMGGMGSMRHVDRMLDIVNASADQRAQIKRIADAARTDLMALHEAGRKLHEQNQGLFTQPTIDPRAIEAARQQMLAHHDQVSKRMTQALIDASRVLTPEQRKTLADHMAQRRAMMERHRAERDSLEKGRN